VKNDEITRVIERYLALADSPRNQDLLHKTWLRPNLAYIDDIGVPQPGVVPIIAVPQLSMWARKMGLSVAQTFTDPAVYLKVFLTREIDRFTQIGDDRPLNKRFPVLLGGGFEAAFFGSRQVYSDLEDPWTDRNPVIRGLEDLQRLELPDFHRGGLMPLAHSFFEELSQLVAGTGLEITFADWGRSPFSVATILCGMEPLAVALLNEPEFAKHLLAFLTQSAIHYRRARAKFLGQPALACGPGGPGEPDKPVFHDDEVNVPSLSPRSYRNLILPLEKEYAAAFSGLQYWHSCGNVTPMIPAIREIPDITIFHCGPWTDVGRAADVFGDITLDVCVHAMDVYESPPEAVTQKVRGIVQTCHARGARSFSIRPGILQSFKSPEEDLDAIARWVHLARQAVEGAAA